MLRIRIFGVAAAIVVALAASAAVAQTATDNHAGKPLALLAGLTPPHATKAHEAKAHEAKTHAAKAAGHAKIVVRKTNRVPSEKVAARKTRKLASDRRNNIAALPSEEQPTAPTTAPVNNWSAAEARPPADNATAASPSPLPDNGQSAVVVAGETVQVTSPDQVNDIDLAADNDAGKTALAADRAPAAPVAQAVFAAPVPKEASPVGSTSWIAQVLAALGGAVAAGTVAWFLIGGGPQRMYG